MMLINKNEDTYTLADINCSQVWFGVKFDHCRTNNNLLVHMLSDLYNYVR